MKNPADDDFGADARDDDGGGGGDEADWISGALETFSLPVFGASVVVAVVASQHRTDKRLALVSVAERLRLASPAKFYVRESVFVEPRPSRIRHCCCSHQRGTFSLVGAWVEKDSVLVAAQRAFLDRLACVGRPAIVGRRAIVDRRAIVGRRAFVEKRDSKARQILVAFCRLCLGWRTSGQVVSTLANEDDKWD